MKEFKGRVAVVTYATGGIGRGVLEDFSWLSRRHSLL